jgi:HEPN domain-containing protein
MQAGFVSLWTEVGVVNKAQFQQLAQDRIVDARCLLDGRQWGGAYYLAGYAVECGLKACILAHVEAVGAIFQDKKFSEKCWTHDLEELLKLANLKPTLDADAAKNAALSANWAAAKDWKETSRYEQKTQTEAKTIYDAIAIHPDGVLPWLRIRW